MALSKALQKFVEQAKSSDSYWVEKAKLEYAAALEKQRKSAGMTYAALAKKIGTSAAYITKVFRGDSNLTIESMVKLARASGGRLNIEVVHGDSQVRQWESLAKYDQVRRITRTTANTATLINFPCKNVKLLDREAA